MLLQKRPSLSNEQLHSESSSDKEYRGTDIYLFTQSAFWDGLPLCSPGWPSTCSAAQMPSTSPRSPVSAPQVQELQGWLTTCGHSKTEQSTALPIPPGQATRTVSPTVDTLRKESLHGSMTLRTFHAVVRACQRPTHRIFVRSASYTDPTYRVLFHM